MGRYQLRLLLLALVALVLIVLGVFVSEWFVIRFAGHAIHVDLRTARMCDPQCVTLPLRQIEGMYPALAGFAFWTALPLFVVVTTQVGARMLSGVAYPPLATLGSALGAITFFTGVGAGFVAIPEATALAGFELIEIERTFAPLWLVLGALASVVAVRYAVTEPVDDDPGYIPIVVPRPGDSRDGGTRLPVTPLSVNKLPTPVVPYKAASVPTVVRTKSPSQPPAGTGTSTAEPRPKSPSKPPAGPPSGSITIPPRARTTSSQPIDVDVSARLGATGLASLDVAIRPPLPEPPTIPEDQIAVAPEWGLVIRKRNPTGAQEPITTTNVHRAPTATEDGTLPLPPDVGMTIRTRPPSVAPPMMASVASALGVAAPSPLAGKVNYAVTTAAFSGAGITATREDGLSRLVTWAEIVGIVARRLPDAEPFEGQPFVDIVSTAGATMRILPTTKITGHEIDGDPTERARSLVTLVASQALDAKLDGATKVFANGNGKPAQLRDDKTLATHDERLA